MSITTPTQGHGCCQYNTIKTTSGRSRALDARGNYTPWSQAFTFRFSGLPFPTDGWIPVLPNLVYPLPYYAPDSAAHPVYDDHTIAWPLFVWDTAHASETPINYRAIPDYYRISVAITDTFASPIVYEADDARAGGCADVYQPLAAAQMGRSTSGACGRIGRTGDSAIHLRAHVIWRMRFDRNQLRLHADNYVDAHVSGGRLSGGC